MTKQNWIPGPFDYERLDVTAIARETLRRVTRLAKGLPRGNASLADQMTRSVESAWLQGAEGASRRGADAKNRFRGAYAEAGETAAAVEAAMIRGLVDEQEAREIRAMLARQCAMLGRLAR